MREPGTLDDLRNIVELAERQRERSRYADQLAGIEARLQARSGRRRWAMAAAAVLVAAAVGATLQWRRTMRAEATMAPTGHQAPAWGGAEPTEGRSVAPPKPTVTSAVVETPAPVRDASVRPEPMPARQPVAPARSRPDVEAEPDRRPPPEPELTAGSLLRRANAARADRDVEAARASLLELRERFPDAAEAEEATFLLGRVEHDLGRNPVAATQWFARYVDAYPEGRYAASARGRVLEACAERGDDDARRAAGDYLDHHPDGPYAALARRTIQEMGEEMGKETGS